MSGGERNDDQTAAPSFDIRASDDIGWRVVAALDEDVRVQRTNDRERRVFGEDDHGVDALERREHVRAIGLGADRASRAFETPHGVVAIEADDERVGRGARGHEQIDVPAVQQIEHAVGERDAAGAGPPRHGIA